MKGALPRGRCSIDTSLSVLILDTTSDITKVSGQEMINNINNLSENFIRTIRSRDQVTTVS